MTLQHSSASTIKLDRLTVCFKEPNHEHVTNTVNSLLEDKINDDIPGARFGTNSRYKVSAVIPFPHFHGETDGHPVCFEAGPRQPGTPSYRLDFNPSKLTGEGLTELRAYLDTSMDATPFEFFHNGYVTRLDVAVDLPAHTLEDVIVRSARKRKHGVYSNADGEPETVYLGTPRSKRSVAYTKTDKETGEIFLRFESRLNPKCLGMQVATLDNPLKGVKLIPVTALEALDLGFPTQLLADSIRVRGIKKAIKPFDKQARKAVEKAIEQAASLLPDGETLWSQWPQALISIGLGEELCATVPKNISPSHKSFLQEHSLFPAPAA